MQKSFIRASGLVAVVLASTAYWSIARAGDVKSMGATPDYDQLIKSLTPPPAEVGKSSRGLRVLSAGTPTTVATNSGSGHAAAAAPVEDMKAPAVALDVRFAVGSDQLTDGARDTVSRIGAALKSSQLSGYRFLVEGHTDSTGNPDANLDLSRRRAEAVKTFLVSNVGLPSDRLETVGKGSTEPLDVEHPASGVNRRVQIVNLGQ